MDMNIRYGDANVNGTETTNNFNQTIAPSRSKSVPANGHRSSINGNTCHTAALTFKEFTNESLHNMRKRRRRLDKESVQAGQKTQAQGGRLRLNSIQDRVPCPEPDPYLASGQQLPHAIVRQLPSQLVGKPIEDIDPYYANQETFVIISKGKELTRFTATKALCLFGAFHPVRRIVLYILVNPMFNLFVILTILINCILMTIQGGDLVERTEIIFTIIYTTEMGLKVLARGFIMEQFTYLRDPWNWLDFLVIIMAYLTIVIEDLGNLSVMRTFRVLRALKTVAIIPGMKTIVGAVIDSVKNLKDVVVLTLFSLSVFSLLGLQIYMGLLTQKCILNGPSNMTDSEWFSWANNSSHWVPEPDDEIFGAYRLCGNATGAQSCPPNHTCLQGFGPNPDYGFTNFDTFGWALICSFRLMTQDFWEGLYMQVLKTGGSWHIIFFIVSIFLGSIYLMNLILAIVAMSYNELQRRAEEEEEAAALDEAAFLESCRLMELAEQAESEYSNGRASPATGNSQAASYRPSVEIGLAGQSLLASLCQNGLLGQKVVEKLNQHIRLTGQEPITGQGRSHSLSYDLEHGRHRVTPDVPDRSSLVGRQFSIASYQESSGIQRASLAPYKQTHPCKAQFSSKQTTSSMKELPSHYNSTNRLSTVGLAPTEPSAFYQVSRSSDNSPNGNLHSTSNEKTPETQSNESTEQSDLDLKVKFGEQMAKKDVHLLKQRAAMIRIVSVGKSKSTQAGLLSEKPDTAQSLDPLQTSDLESSAYRTSGQCKIARRFSTTTGRYGPSASIPLQFESHEGLSGCFYGSSPKRLSCYDRPNVGQEVDSSPWMDSGKGERLSPTDRFRRSNRFRSEVAICKQPISIHPFAELNNSLARERCSSMRDESAEHSIGDEFRASSKSPIKTKRSHLNGQVGKQEKQEHRLSQTGLGEASRWTQSSRSRLSPSTKIGGSALVLCQNQATCSTANSPVGSLGSTHTVQQLGINQQASRMHHLSVENFQMFGATTSACKANSAGSARSSLTPEDVKQAIQSRMATQSRHESTCGESLLNFRGRLESQANIRPETMLRPVLARGTRPRPSVVYTYQMRPRVSMSKELSRRASDWSRMSMTANVDLRRLIRLWSHTNPYQPRPSIGSFSNYSQAGVNLNSRTSIMDLNNQGRSQQVSVGHSLANSPRPSSVGSARQAYELISALSRRHQRYPYDYRYSIAFDGDGDDEEVSVNMRDKCLAYCLSCLDMLCIWECCAPWLAIQKIISVIVFDPFTELFIILCILINTLFLALDNDDTDAHLKIILDRGNYFFTATFAVEASLKIMALSPKFYFREGWNVFDSIIVGLSLLELGLEGVYGLSVMRAFRLLRVFKLAKSWPTLNLLISIMGKAVGDLGNLTFVLAIIVFIFAVMGMQLFGNKYVDRNFPSGELPRWNFTDFMHSFMIVFRILCAEWIEPMWDCLLVGGWPCIPFFLTAVTIGNLVVLNLFLALLLASFGASNLSSPQADNVDTKKLQDAVGRFSRCARWFRSYLGRLLYRNKRAKEGATTQGINIKSEDSECNFKSHIAAMSKLERMKSIEARTEELKSKIKRSPEHHYHLRQLAQMQLKESRLNMPQPGVTPHGLNFNYTTRQPDALTGPSSTFLHNVTCDSTYESSTPIPIIVNEAAEMSNDSQSVDLSVNSLHYSNQDLKTINESKPTPVSDYNQLVMSPRASYYTCPPVMQPIPEDARDAELGSISEVELSKFNTSSNCGNSAEKISDLYKCKERSSSGKVYMSVSQEFETNPAPDATIADSEERPKSSLYLKAPERQDMEEDDDRTLQHIEKYMENCICLGILCLKWFLFRQYIRKIVEHRYFDQCILALIVISSGTLALEDKHLNERPTLKKTLDVLDTIFTIIFSLEMIFKWLAFGLRRYFGNIWSWLDFFIVLVSFMNLMASIFGSGKIQALKTMRTLRAMRGLRPLRALQRFQGMRVVVNALIQAIPSIFNVLLVCLIFWLIFSIMGVQMFGGKFWRCIHPDTKQVVTYEQAANRFECIERNLTWANPQINFDNVLNAYLALFQVATFKGWIDIMNSATDSRIRDDQPTREANIYMYFYFVFFVIFGSFFTLNLFIGVIIDNFNEQKRKTGGSLEIFMTDDQKKYYHAMKKMRSKRPVKAMTRPKFKLQAYMFDLTTSKKFDMAIMIIIGLNMFIMALEHYGQSQEFSVILEDLNLIFIGIFTLECMCKIFAMRHFYFREPWNVFDFIVVNLSIVGVLMKEYVAKYFVSPTLLRVVRVVKVGRVLRLVKGAKGIRTLLFALAMSLPALLNICLLLFLVMFIYAIFGMSFFMNVRPRAGIDETFNFETFSSSIIVLFQMSTSAGWDLVLDPLMDEENDCQKPDPVLGIEGTCGNKGVAIFYLISYVIVTFLIIINMYIAVILENYSQATEDVQEGLTDDDYEMYYEIWQKFDPNGTQFLPYEKLSDFVDALEDPLRIPKPNELALVVLDINIYEGNQCYCVDILDALTKYFFTRKGLVIQVNEQLQKVQSSLHEVSLAQMSKFHRGKMRLKIDMIILPSTDTFPDHYNNLPDEKAALLRQDHSELLAKMEGENKR